MFIINYCNELYFFFRLNKVVNGKPIYAYLEVEIERKEDANSSIEINEVEIAFARTKEFDDSYAEYKLRRNTHIKRKELSEQGFIQL